MKLLLDTHALLWMFGRSHQLSGNARAAIANADNELFFSIAGYWEIGIKISIGRLELSRGWETSIPKEMVNNGIVWLPIAPSHIHLVAGLPLIHRDPVDRILIAQAMTEQMTILTNDPYFPDYTVPVLW